MKYLMVACLIATSFFSLTGYAFENRGPKMTEWVVALGATKKLAEIKVDMKAKAKAVLECSPHSEPEYYGLEVDKGLVGWTATLRIRCN